MKTTIIEGRCWLINTPEGTPIDDIDTDMIFHNAHLAITDIGEMGKHAFGNLDDWKDFPEKAKEGDILIAGKNFGAGSSRQQAVDCFSVLGVKAIVAESFGAIYFRNAVNAGFPVIPADKIMQSGLKSGNIIRLNFETGEIFNVTKNASLPTGKPFSEVQHDIYNAGSLFKVKPQ